MRCTELSPEEILLHRLVCFVMDDAYFPHTSVQYARFQRGYLDNDDHVDHGEHWVKIAGSCLALLLPAGPTRPTDPRLRGSEVAF